VVITVTYNSASTIRTLLESLADERSHIRGVVVVDNGSSDNTLDLVRQVAADSPLDLILVESTNSGFAGGYEVGRREIELLGHPILCVNPDVSLARGTIGRLLEALRLSPTVAIATAPLVDLNGQEDSACRRSLPNLASGSLYGVFGKLLPARWRYNSRPNQHRMLARLPSGLVVNEIEATTGALMMLSPSFRDGSQPIFDLDYWMYGEDLQLCFDAARRGRKVVMVEAEPSLHVKGVSSGWPRSPSSHRAFHEAMLTYYRKNLRTSAILSALVTSAIWTRFALTSSVAAIARHRSRRMPNA
jgi:N-acetylglucosaminyl-diphospho-decaprenol L-rhamnosyltransferase